jgi:integrase
MFENNGKNIRYLSLTALQGFFAVIDNWEHKLMMRLIYESGCRVGEFVRIRLKHLDFGNHSVFFPAENTKSKQARTSYVSADLMNDLKDYLKRRECISKRYENLLYPDEFLFVSQRRTNHLNQSPTRLWKSDKGDKKNQGLSENRVRQIFSGYIQQASLQQVYGHDKKGRALHLYTVHSLRHSHIMHAKHIKGIKDSIVAKQVGHLSLQAMSAYDQPSWEMVKSAYEKAGRE